MDRTINIEHLFREMIKNKKVIVVVSVLVSICFIVYGHTKAINVINSQNFGAYGELYIPSENASELHSYGISLENENVSIIDKRAETIVALLQNDEVINNVCNCELVKKYDLSAIEVRESIFLKTSQNGSILKVNVVGDNQEECKAICTAFLEQGVTSLNDEGYNVKINRMTESLGTVAVSTKESDSEGVEKVYIVNKVTARTIGVKDYIVDMLEGLILGIILSVFLISIRFVVSGKIVYKEQIDYINNVKLLNGKENKLNIVNAYSELLISYDVLKVISFASLRKVRELDNIVFDFAKLLSQAGKHILIVEYVNDLSNVENEIIENDGIDLLKREYKSVFSETNSKETSYAYNRNYDLTIIKVGDISANPSGKAIIAETDSTIVLIEKNTVKISELERIRDLYQNTNDSDLGVLLV